MSKKTDGAGNELDSPRDAASDATLMTQVYEQARAIPPGRVLGYGALGARCDPPISGYICGRIMNQALQDVPWWRVVAKDGSLPISKRNLALAQEQRQKLQAEGVEFDDEGRVLMERFSGEDKAQSSLF
ncbi:MAG TPA: MGMT family protein [Abditibacteriaceae bacterium]|jgi:methylated-DNA-protein-cysteine methyltransferase-like protein